MLLKRHGHIAWLVELKQTHVLWFVDRAKTEHVCTFRTTLVDFVMNFNLTRKIRFFFFFVFYSYLYFSFGLFMYFNDLCLLSKILGDRFMCRANVWFLCTIVLL